MESQEPLGTVDEEDDEIGALRSPAIWRVVRRSRVRRTFGTRFGRLIVGGCSGCGLLFSCLALLDWV